MFRKVIANLSYSPALIESLSRLAVKFKKEEYLRRMGLVFLILTLLVQLFITLLAPQQSNAANQTDTIYGGFGSIEDFMDHYDHNNRHIRDVLISLGITRYDISHAKKTTLAANETIYRVGISNIKNNIPTKSFTYRTSGDISDTKTQPAYVSQTTSASNHTAVYAGSSERGEWFALNMADGDILLKSPPKEVSIHDTCPVELTGLNVKCSDFFSQTAHNKMYDGEINNKKAKEDDHILYRFTATNPSSSNKAVSVPFTADLYDALEYASIIDSGGGEFDKQRGIISWPNVTLQPGESTTHIAVIKVAHSIPATGNGVSNPSSFNCIMTSTLSTSNLSIPVECPRAKQLESIIANLPSMTPWLAMLELFVVIIAVVLYARSIQLKEEIRLVRKDFNSGTIG